jgi:hypothetical protein
MSSSDPSLVVKVSANITALQQGLASAAQELKKTEAQFDTVAKGMSQAGQAATTAAGPVKDLGASFRSFDGILASLGIHIGPEIRGIGELGAASGKSAGELGKLATAGLIVGAGIAGWKIGRAIADFFDLDEKIGNATAKLLGWGDVASQVAGAGTDAIALAFERTGIHAANATEAFALNDKWFKEHVKTTQAAVKAGEEWTAAMVELNSIGGTWQATLDTIDGETVEAIKWALEGGASQGVLATAYELTGAQVRAVASAMTAAKDAAAAEKKDLDLLIDAYEMLRLVTGKEAAKLATQMLVEQQVQLGIVNTAILAELDAQTKLNAAQGRDAAGAFQVQTSAAETLRIGLEKLEATKVAGVSTTAQAQVLTDAFTQSLYDEAVAIDKEFAALRAANGETAKVPELKKAAADATVKAADQIRGTIAAGATQDPRFASQEGRLNMLVEQQQTNPGIFINPTGLYDGMNFSHRALGGPVSPGQSYMVGERGPELFRSATAGSIVPNGGGSGGSEPRVIQLVVDGRVLASVLDNATMNRQRDMGTRF